LLSLSLSLAPRAHEGECLAAHGAERWRKQAQKAKCENSTCPQIAAPSSGDPRQWTYLGNLKKKALQVLGLVLIMVFFWVPQFINEQMFFWANFRNLLNFFLLKKHPNFVILGTFSPFFEIKIIKLAISRPRHFLGCYLKRFFLVYLESMFYIKI
jgi:hypothetical protein